MTQTERKTDTQIQADVLTELRWDSRLENAAIGVEVHDGIVTLSGAVPSYAARIAAQEAAHRVFGTLDVVNHVDVRLPGNRTRTDADLAGNVRLALSASPLIHAESIRTTVWEGIVTLEGEVERPLQKIDAERIVREVRGVRRVVNRLAAHSARVAENEIRESIKHALHCEADDELDHIDVSVDDGHVTIAGLVRSLREKQVIVSAASRLAGQRSISDSLVVTPGR